MFPTALTLAALLTPDAAAEPVALYRTWADLAADRPAAVIDATLLQRSGAHGVWGLAGAIDVYKLDLARVDARPLGSVFAFAVGDAVYVNDGAPIPARGQEYARLETWGDVGFYQHRTCYLVPNGGQDGGMHEHCDLTLKLVDLHTGATQLVHADSLRALLADAPDLLAAFEVERPKDLRAVRRYLLAWLERRAAA
jgi:hypothetical protein